MTTAPVRPSQFVTRDGPGALVPTVSGSMLIPSITRIIRYLARESKAQKNFNQPDDDTGATGLHKFVIDDNQMIRILRKFNSKPDKPFENEIQIFSLPTNAELRLKETDDVFRGYIFPKWGICNQHRGNDILMKFSQDRYDVVIRCPKCIQQGIPYKRGFPVRFVQACTNGHLQDLDWPYLVHGKSSCKNQIFSWKELGGDDFLVECTECKKSIHYVRGADSIKMRSINGRLFCGGQLPEMYPSFKSDMPECEKGKDGKSTARLILKNSAGLHTPKLLTSIFIPQFTGSLFRGLTRINKALSSFVEIIPDYTKEQLVAHLEKDTIRKRNQISNDTLFEIKDTPEHDLKKAIENVLNVMDLEEQKRTTQKGISEAEANDEELISLLEAAKEGYPPSDQATERRAFVNVEDIITVKSKEFGLTFRITPIKDIQVTKVQAGYSREIGSSQESDSTRIGKLQRQSCYHEENDIRWFLGDQLRGEAIFIDLVKDNADERGGIEPSVLQDNPNDDLKVWSEINKNVNDLLKACKKGTPEYDEAKLLSSNTNPVFVWWHSLCHKLMINLCVDSGFSVVSLGERVYCKYDERDQSTESGILIYTAARGADGTLGGLVSLVEEKFMEEIFKKTAEGIASCSNDPVCSEIKINQKKRSGACCHACQLVSETTCSYQNKLLDRNLVRGTLDGSYR